VSTVGIVSLIVALVVMILVHEWGHYITARKFGMKVESYFLGFGPKLWSTMRGETEYGVRAFPLGGYVKITGMNPFVPVAEEDRDRTFTSKPRWQRAIVLLAGSGMNFALGFVALVLIFGAIGLPVTTLGIGNLTKGDGGTPMPAETAGIQAGDRLVEIDGVALNDWGDVVEVVRSSPGEELSVTLLRGDERLTTTVVPATVEETQPDGSTIEVGRLGVISELAYVREPPHRAVWSAGRATVGYIALSYVGLKNVFFGEEIRSVFSTMLGSGEREATEESLIGPVGAGRIAGQVAEQSVVDLMFFLVGIVIFVGAFNLLPIPVLDGGYLAVILFESITRRDVNFKRLVPVWVVVFGLLLLLGISLLYLDIVRPINLPN
jgi:membrane-associated protease RseP (regulator of RpoE activity)